MAAHLASLALRANVKEPAADRESRTFLVTTLEHRPTPQKQQDDAGRKGQVARQKIFDGRSARTLRYSASSPANLWPGAPLALAASGVSPGYLTRRSRADAARARSARPTISGDAPRGASAARELRGFDGILTP
jgi:hypothetical protein